MSLSMPSGDEACFSYRLVFYNPMQNHCHRHQLMYQMHNPSLQDDDYCFKNEKLVGSDQLIKCKEEDGGSVEDSNWPSKMQKSGKKTSDCCSQDQKIISFSSNYVDESAHAQDHRDLINNISVHEKTQIRVCSDCCTTKTPLWRSGPNGPKSLCNACGIRQRKARRAMTIAAESQVKVKIHQKHKTNTNPIHVNKNSRLKKHHHIKSTAAGLSSTNHKRHDRWPCKADSTVEDFFRNSSKNLAFQRVIFPQDERDAAILLMALSSGLVHA